MLSNSLIFTAVYGKTNNAAAALNRVAVNCFWQRTGRIFCHVTDYVINSTPWLQQRRFRQLFCVWVFFFVYLYGSIHQASSKRASIDRGQRRTSVIIDLIVVVCCSSPLLRDAASSVCPASRTNARRQCVHAREIAASNGNGSLTTFSTIGGLST